MTSCIASASATSVALMPGISVKATAVALKSSS